MIILGEGVESVENSPHGCWGRNPFHAPVDWFPQQTTPSATTGTFACTTTSSKPNLWSDGAFLRRPNTSNHKATGPECVRSGPSPSGADVLESEGCIGDGSCRAVRWYPLSACRDAFSWWRYEGLLAFHNSGVRWCRRVVERRAKEPQIWVWLSPAAVVPRTSQRVLGSCANGNLSQRPRRFFLTALTLQLRTTPVSFKQQRPEVEKN